MQGTQTVQPYSCRHHCQDWVLQLSWLMCDLFLISDFSFQEKVFTGSQFEHYHLHSARYVDFALVLWIIAFTVILPFRLPISHLDILLSKLSHHHHQQPLGFLWTKIKFFCHMWPISTFFHGSLNVANTIFSNLMQVFSVCDNKLDFQSRTVWHFDTWLCYRWGIPLWNRGTLL